MITIPTCGVSGQYRLKNQECPATFKDRFCNADWRESSSGNSNVCLPVRPGTSHHLGTSETKSDDPLV